MLQDHLYEMIFGEESIEASGRLLPYLRSESELVKELKLFALNKQDLFLEVK